MNILNSGLSIIVLLVTSSINAATLNFTGALDIVILDNGNSIYSGAGIGDVFSGSIVYGNSAAEADAITMFAPDRETYSFAGSPYGGSVTGNSITTIGTSTRVDIYDNYNIGNFTSLNDIYGPGTVTGPEIADMWATEGLYSYTNAGRGRTLFFRTLFFYLDTEIYSDTSFNASPPSLSGADYAIFSIVELEAGFLPTFVAAGELTSTSIVPIPPSIWLFGFGLSGLIGISRILKKNM